MIDQMIERIEALGELAAEAAPQVSRAVEGELRRQIRAGTDPDGKAWRKRADGGKPLETAAKALRVTALGPRVFCVIRGHIARHHLGRAKGGIERKILPTGRLPRALERVVRAEVVKAFGRVKRGG